MFCPKCKKCAGPDSFDDDGICWGCKGILTLPAEEWAEMDPAARQAARAKGIRPERSDTRTMDAPSHPDSSNYG